jgi:hypothetical protein
MPRVIWPLQRNRPIVQAQVVDATSGHMVTRTLLADTGPGGLDAPFELILRVSDANDTWGYAAAMMCNWAALSLARTPFTPCG